MRGFLPPVLAIVLCLSFGSIEPASAVPSRKTGPSSVAGVMLPVRTSVILGVNARKEDRWIVEVAVGGARVRLYSSSERSGIDTARILSGRLSVCAARASQMARFGMREGESGATLLWDGKAVWMLTPEAALEYGRPAREVVSGWATALKAAHPTAFLPDSLDAPAGEERILDVPPNLTGAIPSDPEVVHVQLRGHLLHISGRVSGTSRVTFTGPGHPSLEIHVLDAAGFLPVSLQLAFSGPYSRELVTAGLERALSQQTRLAPEGGISAFWDTLEEYPDRPSRITAWVEGPALASRVASLQVLLSAAAETPAEPTHLVASNNPEVLRHPGTLLDQVLMDGTTWYYYHHHDPLGGGSRTLQVTLQNRGDSPARMLVAHSGAGPSPDEIYAGHLATWRFLGWEQHGNAWVVSLPAGASYVLDRRYLSENAVACGIGSIGMLEGNEVHMVVEARGGGEVPLPDRPEPVRARGLYPKPVIELKTEYRQGGPWAFILLGGPPYPKGTPDDLPNDGNYGVLYRIVIHLSNPTQETAQVYAALVAGGGAARGSLRVDGHFCETPVVGARPGQVREAPLRDWTLEPGEERDVEIIAIPEPGSNYPVKIVVKNLPANR